MIAWRRGARSRRSAGNAPAAASNAEAIACSGAAPSGAEAIPSVKARTSQSWPMNSTSRLSGTWRKKHGFIPILIEIARSSGRSAYVAEGANRWPAGHTLDVARLYRLALEGAPAGSRLHAVDDEGVPLREIAEAIGRKLGITAASIPTQEMEAHFGFIAFVVSLDNPTSSARTRELLGWAPTHPGLLADLDEGHYFSTM